MDGDKLSKSVSFAYIKELVGILKNIPECKDDAVWLLDTYLVQFEGEDYIIFRKASDHQRYRNFYNRGKEFVPDLLVQLQQILGNGDGEYEDQMIIDTPSLPKGPSLSAEDAGNLEGQEFMDSLMPDLQNLDLGDDIDGNTAELAGEWHEFGLYETFKRIRPTDENMPFSVFHSMLKHARNEIAIAERNQERTKGGAAAKEATEKGTGGR